MPLIATSSMSLASKPSACMTQPAILTRVLCVPDFTRENRPSFCRHAIDMCTGMRVHLAGELC